MFWIILTAVMVALVIWKGYIVPYSYWKNMGVPQARPWFLLGDTWPTMLRLKNILEYMDWLYYMHPNSKFVGMYSFYIRTLMIRDPDIIRQLAVKDFDYFTDHNSFSMDEEVDPLWSGNLFSLKGQKWRDMRALLSGSFTSSKMRIIYTLISEESEKFVNYFLKKDESQIEVELKETFTKYTNDVIASASFGIKVDSLEDPDNEFFQMGKLVSNFSGFIVMLKFIAALICPRLLKIFKITFFPKKVSTFFTRIVDETIEAREKQGIVRPDMINLLMEVRKGQSQNIEKEIPDSGFAVVRETIEIVKPPKKQIEITNKDIASQALVFFLAGFDSVSSTMCYTCYELAINPDIQEKLRMEIKKMSEKTSGKPSYEDILSIKYLDMVISEALRKWPVAPASDRICNKPYTLEPTNPNDPTVTFRVSDNLWIPIYSIQNDPQYYHHPEKFYPERFSDENKGNITPYTFMPFGVGPRACIGSRFALLEIKSVLFHLLNNFEVMPTEKTKVPLKFKTNALNLSPEGGFPLALKRLKNVNAQI